MSTLTRFVGEDALENLKQEDNNVGKVGKALRQYIPTEATSFYLLFFSAAADQQKEIQELTQSIILPLLGLFLTIVFSAAKNYDSKSSKNQWFKKIDWYGVIVSFVAFVGWVYVTGGHFFTWEMNSFIASIVFFFISLVAPVGYGFTKKTEG